MNIVICDDHTTFSEALQEAWRSRGHHVARAGSPREVAALDEVDVVVLDLGFPGLAECEAVEIVRTLLPTVPVVVLTGRVDGGLIGRAFELGAKGAVLKQEPLDELESVIERVVSTPLAASGQRLAVCSRQVRALRRGREAGHPGGALTARERQVLEHLSAGWSTPQIAETMGVRISTVRTHVQHLLTKFGVHSRLELVASARKTKTGRHGLLPQLQ
jgi:two-component system, NarL family, nitrate/nitrite response regulator NarL